MLRVIAAIAAASVVLAPSADGAKKKKTFVYVHDHQVAPDGAVHGFQLEADGTLTAVANSPYAASSTTALPSFDANTLAYSKAKKVLVASSGADLHSFVVGTDGSLTAAPGSPFTTALPEQRGIAIVEIGDKTFVVSIDQIGSLIDTFEVAADGSILDSAQVPVSVAAAPPAAGAPVGIAAAGALVYVLRQTDNVIDKFEIGPAGEIGDSALVEKSIPTLAENARTIEITPDGKSIYVPGNGDLWIGAISRTGDDLHLAPLAKFPFDPSDDTGALRGLAVTDTLVATFEQSGGGVNDVRFYSRATSGVLTPHPKYGWTSIDQVAAIEFSPKADILLTASPDLGLVSYEVKAGVGSLTRVEVEALPTGSTLALTDILVVQL